MLRFGILFLVTLALGITLWAAEATVTIDGKTVIVPTVVSNGKAYVDIVALMKLLGGSAAYNATGNSVAITTGKPAPPAGGSIAAPGTPQLPGPDGKLNWVYTMRKSDPIYFRLISLEYTTEPIVIGNGLYAPKVDEKLLVLHFTVQNPDKTEKFVRYDSLHFTAVDAVNNNHEAIADWGDTINKGSVEINMKPAQTMEMYTAIIVPAKGIIPKLMVLPPNETDGPVLRYDLHDIVKPLAAPIVDPSDLTGATALAEVTAQVGTSYPYANFRITTEKFTYTTDALGDSDARTDGERFLVITLLIKNMSPSEQYLRYDTITPVVSSTDGEEMQYNDMLLPTTNRVIAQNVKAGQEQRVRLYFTIPKDVTPKTFSLKEGDSRAYLFDVKE